MPKLRGLLTLLLHFLAIISVVLLHLPVVGFPSIKHYCHKLSKGHVSSPADPPLPRNFTCRRVTPPLYNDTVNTSQFPERFMDLEGDDVDLEGDDVDLDDITVILDQDRCTVDIIKSAQVRLSVRCTL